MTTLPDIARSTSEAHGMIPPGSTVLALVSGGADSTALLLLLASGALGPADLSVLHVDHLLRGAESDGDAAAVADLCRRLGVPCRVVRYDVAAYADGSGLNLEDAGRRVRYRFADEELDARCAEAGVPATEGRIATAHTLDDRAETMLMRLAQGAGAGGLLAPPYRRGRVVRPLLDASRAEVVAYLRERGEPWREDSTNADTTRLRARVRAELVPLLRDINPRFDEALARTVTVLAAEDALLDTETAAAVASLVTWADGEVRIERAAAALLPRALQRRVVRAALHAAFPEASRIEFDHVEAVSAGLAADAFARDLGGGLRAFTEYGTLIISRGPGAATVLAPTLLPVPGTAVLGDAGSVEACDAGPGEVTADPDSALVDADIVVGPLVVDSVRPGDRIRPLGMEGTRKLQDVLTDAKVPRRSRSIVPVVRDGERIVWVAGVRMSEDYRIGPGTRRAIRLTLRGPSVRKDEA